MDEIDAALDFRNVSIVANYIKERTKNAQFIVISLRNNMFELAARLVGIYKTSNMVRRHSKTILTCRLKVSPSIIRIILE
jgi:structural maintenance of chromosome 4